MTYITPETAADTLREHAMGEDDRARRTTLLEIARIVGELDDQNQYLRYRLANRDRWIKERARA